MKRLNNSVAGVGMNMLLWSTDVTTAAYDEIFGLLADLGYDGVEIPIFDAETDKYRALGERLDSFGLQRLAVAVRGTEDNPIAADARVRARAVAATKANIDSAAAVGAPLLCGPLTAALGAFSGSGPTAAERERAVAHFRQIGPYAEERGVTVALEYLNRFELYFLNNAADLASLVREVDHPSIRMMYDTFHAHIEEKDVGTAIHGCADVLVHFHASENDRSTPGAGQVDWGATFDALAEIGYDGWIVIEAFGDLLPDLAAATKIWRRMFESEEQLARDGLAFLRTKLSQSAPEVP